MAKMFYSLEEAAERLAKSPDEIRQMASRNEITEFRDGEKLIFKVEQIDLLAGDADDDDEAGLSDDSMIPLVDSAEQSALGLSDSGPGAGSGTGVAPGGSGLGMSGTGISVFDADDLEEADPGAATMVTEEPLDSVSLESFGSGSGLMDLTRESDDTSLGADGLLDELYGADEAAEGGEPIGESGLFEGVSASAGLEEGDGAPAGAMVAAESVDPKWSGLVGGLSIGMLAATGLGLAMVLMAVVGSAPEQIGSMFGGNTLVWMGAMLGGTLLLGGVGFFVGSRR